MANIQAKQKQRQGQASRPGEMNPSAFHRLLGSRTRGNLKSARRVRIALQALQIGAEVRRRAIAQPAVFFQRLVDDLFELRRDGWIETRGRRRRTVENGLEHYSRCISQKGLPARRHFVQNKSEREQVR